jgi:hypothetical protein
MRTAYIAIPNVLGIRTFVSSPGQRLTLSSICGGKRHFDQIREVFIGEPAVAVVPNEGKRSHFFAQYRTRDTRDMRFYSLGRNLRVRVRVR